MHNGWDVLHKHMVRRIDLEGLKGMGRSNDLLSKSLLAQRS